MKLKRIPACAADAAFNELNSAEWWREPLDSDFWGLKNYAKTLSLLVRTADGCKKTIYYRIIYD